MPRATVVRLSSKGQLVIPAALRRTLGLVAGQSLSVRAGADGEVVLSPVGLETAQLAEMLERTRAWARANRRDLVAELHASRDEERKKLTRKA